MSDICRKGMICVPEQFSSASLKNPSAQIEHFWSEAVVFETYPEAQTHSPDIVQVPCRHLQAGHG